MIRYDLICGYQKTLKASYKIFSKKNIDSVFRIKILLLTFVVLVIPVESFASVVEINTYMCDFDKSGNSDCDKIKKIRVKVSSNSGSVFVGSDEILNIVKKWFETYQRERARLDIEIIDAKGHFLFKNDKKRKEIMINVSTFKSELHRVITVVAISKVYYKIQSSSCEVNSKECIIATIDRLLTKVLSGVE